ncbi:MAG: hypothetical protein WAX48_10675 [Desulfosalsimonadaceae bacterium]
MTTIIPEGDDLRNAVKWISEMVQSGVQKSKMTLINEASLRFDLKPADQEFLMRCYEEVKTGEIK